MRRIGRYMAMLVCISLLVTVSAAQDHNESGVVEDSEHSFDFETVEASNTSEEFDYNVDNSTVEMNGTVQMPTPCHELETDLSPGDEEYELEINAVENTTNDSDSTDGNETESEMCPQVIDYQGFEAVFSASTPYDLVVSIEGDEVGEVSVEEPENESSEESLNETEDSDETAQNESESSVNETETSTQSETDDANNTEDAINNSEEELNDSETENSSEDLGNEANESENLGAENDSDESDVVIESDPENDSENESVQSESENDSATENDSFTQTPEQSTTDQNQGTGLQGMISSVVNFFGSLMPGR